MIPHQIAITKENMTPLIPRLMNGLLAALGLVLLLINPVHAESDLGSLASLAQAYPEAPIPVGWTVGGAALNIGARYAADTSQSYVFPGAIYMADHWAYLGDRARYYLYRNGPFASFAYGRLRVGNLDPDKHPEWNGLNARKSELEAGIGGNLVTPFALLTGRICSDITGRSKGQEALLWADFPVLRGRFLIMPGMGMQWRSRRLANYYFGGISEDEAGPEHPAYEVGNALSFSSALITSYRFSEKWIGLLLLGYEVYDQKISDSPLVQHDGEHMLIVGTGYQF